MIERKFGVYGGFWTLLLAGFVIVALFFGEYALIILNNKKAYINILSIVLAGFIIGFSYAFVMANKYYYTGNSYTGKEKQIHYKKNDEYMVSLWIMMGVSLVCSIGYFVAEAYL